MRGKLLRIYMIYLIKIGLNCKIKQAKPSLLIASLQPYLIKSSYLEGSDRSMTSERSGMLNKIWNNAVEPEVRRVVLGPVLF